ncbi:MAG: sulfotransferase [Gemmatimonadota bacterium]
MSADTGSADPIFVYSVGRSGSTVFHEIFTRHPDVAWLSPLCDRWPQRFRLHRGLLRLVDAPLLGAGLRRRFHPDECYRFWDHHCPGFSTPCRDLVADDVTEAQRRAVLCSLGRLTTGRRYRLLVKITGWPRMGFLSEIFPRARFIHVVRDGRAVVNSMLKVGWWWGWRGPANWRFGELGEVYREEWERYDRSFVALAAIEWKLLLEAAGAASARIDPALHMTIRYEDLCGDPVAVFESVAEFCDLRWPRALERRVRAAGLRSRNDKWRSDLSALQQRILNEALQPHLARLGYE